MDKTRIDWAESSWNPITGCNHGCPYCYARAMVNRFGANCENKYEPATYEVDGKDGSVVYEMNAPAYVINNGMQRKIPYPHGFAPTYHRYKIAEYRKKKSPRNIFVGSMSDIWGEWIPDRWIRELFAVCRKAPQHNYLFLTKNPKRYLDFYETGELPTEDNFWYGTTVNTPNMLFMYMKNVSREARIIPHTFLSIEPILEDFGKFNGEEFVEWVIIGAETGRRKNKVIPRREWIENIVNICREKNIPVFMKSSLQDIWGDKLITEFPKQLLHG